MYKERENGRGISNGTYYLPQISREMVVTNGFDFKVETQLIPAYGELASEGTWSMVQDVMAEVGFFVDKTSSALFIEPRKTLKVREDG